MAAENTRTDVIEQRLDALDRVLLGLLSRSERLSLVADVEARVRGSDEAPAFDETSIPSSAELPAAEASRARHGLRLRRSALALTAGVLGIVALVLLFALPITYLVIVALGEALGELATYVLLSGNVLVVALGGAAAVVMGIIALVRLSRRHGRTGRGWAVTALCTGPLPALVGGLATITVVLPLVGELAGNFGSSGPVHVSDSVCTSCPAPAYASPGTSPPALVANVPATPWAQPSSGAYAAPSMPAPLPSGLPAPEPPQSSSVAPALTSPEPAKALPAVEPAPSVPGNALPGEALPPM
jgi:hypothetical protein